MRNTSPWLRKQGHGAYTMWVRGIETWAQASCLVKHFVIPSKATWIRFVKGKYVDSLRLVYQEDVYYNVRGHRDKRKDKGNIRMLSTFAYWFGTENGYVYVEWK